MSTTEFEPIDPLGGVLHPNWKDREAAEAAKKNCFLGRRLLSRLVDWLRSDEPNLTIGDTQLIVDDWEMKNPPQRTEQEAKEIAAGAAAFEGFVPDKTDFYDSFRSPPEKDKPQ